MPDRYPETAAKAIRAARRFLARQDKLAAHIVLTKSTTTSEPQEDGSIRHSMTMAMLPIPPEYAEVYRRRGIVVPVSCSHFDPAALWPYEPRSAHERHARSNGYFWLPCPLCSRYFGGHEIRASVRLPGDAPGISTGVCPLCSAEMGGGVP